MIFAPNAADMYPDGAETAVTITGLSDNLCGAHRPGHFDGVATIVTKLFNIVGPCTAILGRKDYQQLQVIKRITTDLNLPVTVEGMPTVRESDGLAMSSRNAYLSPKDRTRALTISQALRDAHDLFKGGCRNTQELKDVVAAKISPNVDSVDYIEVADPDTLTPPAATISSKGKLLIAVAVRVGDTRLIDNTVLGEDDAPVEGTKAHSKSLPNL